MARAAVNTISTQIKNYVINGNMDFWQRGISFTTPSSATYTADRFAVEYDGTIGTFTLSQQAFTLGQTIVPGEPQYFLRWNQTVAGSASTTRTIRHRIESVRTLAGKNMTISFYAQADSSRSIGVKLVQNFGSGGTPSASVTVTQQDVTIGTTFALYTMTFTVPSIAGKTLGTTVNTDFLEVRFELPLNTTMTIDLARIMVVEGSAPANFKLAGEDIVGERMMCKRYFLQEVIRPEATASGANIRFQFPIRWSMRITPIITNISQANVINIRAPTTTHARVDTFDTNGGVISMESAAASFFSVEQTFSADAEL